MIVYHLIHFVSVVNHKNRTLVIKWTHYIFTLISKLDAKNIKVPQSKLMSNYNDTQLFILPMLFSSRFARQIRIFKQVLEMWTSTFNFRKHTQQKCSYCMLKLVCPLVMIEQQLVSMIKVVVEQIVFILYHVLIIISWK